MTTKKSNFDLIKGAIYGQIVGDAIGVPVEMVSRYALATTPINGMTGGENTAHQLPPGRWSDDGAMTLALIDSLNNEDDINLSGIADNFIGWLYRGHYTPDDVAFGSGGTTRDALDRYIKSRDPESCGGNRFTNNGNGSLMRILPLAFFLNKKDTDTEDRYEIIKGVSGITHAHSVSVLACNYLVSFAQALADGFNKWDAYNQCRIYFIPDVFEGANDLSETNLSWIDPFKRLVYGNIYDLPEDRINSGFFVVETLEAAIWCIMNTTDYKSAVLTAVNMGGDSDSTAAVVGGLAGLIYGFDDIPTEWVDELPKAEYLEEIIQAFATKFETEIYA